MSRRVLVSQVTARPGSARQRRLEHHEHDPDRPNPRQVPKAVKDRRRARNKQARRQRRHAR